MGKSKRQRSRDRIVNERPRRAWPTNRPGLRPIRDYRTQKKRSAYYTYNPVSKKGYVTRPGMLSRNRKISSFKVNNPFTNLKNFSIVNAVVPGPIRRIAQDPCIGRAIRREVLLASGLGGKGFKKPRWTKKSYTRCK